MKSNLKKEKIQDIFTNLEIEVLQMPAIVQKSIEIILSRFQEAQETEKIKLEDRL